MKIGVIPPPIYTCPPQGYGGEIQTWDLCEALGRLGDEVHLWALPNSQCPPNGYLHYIPSGNLSDFWLKEQYAVRYYRETLMEMDVVHDWTHSHFTHDFLAMRLGKTNVLSTPWGSLIQRPFWRQNLVCWSNFQKDLAIQQGFPASTRVVWGGINTDFYQPDPNRPYEKDGYLLFMGRMHPTKRPDLFIELARRMPEENFVLSGSFGKVGTPDHAYYGQFYREMSNGIPNLVIEPDVSFKRQLEMYQRAKALIFPSMGECFGLVLVQSLASGTPAICSNEGAFPEIIQEGKTGFLCELNLEDYMNAIRNVDSLSPKACRADAISRWNRERVAKGYMEIYKEVASGAVF